MSKRRRGWTGALGEVIHAVRQDPLLLVPIALVVILATLAGYFLWGAV